MNAVGLDNQTGVLTDVLLGRPDHFRWVPLNSISAVTFANMERSGHRFDQERALTQHREMVDVYRRAGDPCRVCGTTIRTLELEGRNVFWCPVCQQ